MSNSLRNPFRMRASEKIISDANFLGIYSPEILELLIEKNQSTLLWNNVSYIHSSPGGGKTSLLRVFEPSVLNSIFTSQSNYKDIFSKLKKIDVLNEDKINVLGVYVLCTRSFEILEDINFENYHKKRLFYSLLNSRIILATLKNVLILKNKKFPDDLKYISINYNNNDFKITGINFPVTGDELYRWAANVEEKIFETLDSLVPIKESSLPGHDQLFSVSLMTSDNITFNSQKICERILFMIDDAHVLTKNQRDSIKSGLIEKRGNYTLWIAERIEVLELEEVINKHISKDRDFQTINIEDFYRGRDSKAALLFSAIAEKRALLSDGLNSFSVNLSNILDEEMFKSNFNHSIEESINFFNDIKRITNKFDKWIDNILNNDLNFKEKAIRYKQLEIIISRQLNKQQLSIDFGFEISNFDNLISSEIKNASDYFVTTKYKIPYYYGFEDVTKISSCNIEQFLSFASELFERMLSNNLLGNKITLEPEEQEKILNDAVQSKWKSLKSSIPYSNIISKFLVKLGSYCKEETDQINAPYAPGINGFAIKDNSKNLFGTTTWYKNPDCENLLNVLTTCVAYNILEVRTTNQGLKGQTWSVYYLNRWLCVYFKLPLSYGNWRPKTPSELIKWTK